jgi:hypothetical protein
MIKFIFLLSLVSLSAELSAQTVTVKKASEKIKGENMDGFATDLKGSRGDASNTLTKILKEHGKIKFLSTDPFVVTNPVLNGGLYEKGVLYGIVREADASVTIWIGRKASDWTEAQLETVDKEIEKLVYEAGIQFYRDQVQKEIDQTQQAIDAVVKQISRFSSQGKDLVKKLENNDQEKIKLLKLMEANTLEDAVLKVKIENNKKAQDSVGNALNHIQEMKKVHQEKMRGIN